MLQKRQLGAIEASAMGIGCVSIAGIYGDADEVEALSVLREALDLGITLIDTADNYGPHTAEILVGRAIEGRRDEVVLCTKGGNLIIDQVTYAMRPEGSPDHLRKSIDDSLRRLNADHVDLYYLHRVDPNVPIEESIGAMAEFVGSGKARGLGVCEVDIETLERAHAVHPISAVQSELSLWTRGPLDRIIPWCEEHGVGFVPYAPLGRGFLTGAITSPDDVKRRGDFRANNPRFQGAALEANLRIVDQVKEVAGRHDATPAQVALAWLLAKSKSILPIPGMERRRFLKENLAALDLKLSAEDIDRLDGLPEAAGARY